MTSAKRGYILDGWGGLHPWATRHATPPPTATASAYWPNWDIARGVSADSANGSGVVVDGYGGLHGFTH